MPALPQLDVSLKTILNKLFVDSDEYITDYMVNSLTTVYSTNKPPRNVGNIATIIGDMLIDYELADNAKQIETICTQIIEQLHTIGYNVDLPDKHEQDSAIKDTDNVNNILKNDIDNDKVKSPLQNSEKHVNNSNNKSNNNNNLYTTEDGNRVRALYIHATDRHRPRLTVNTEILARYSGDNQYYKAIITKVVDDGSFDILYPEYDDSENVDITRIKIFDKLSYGSIWADQDKDQDQYTHLDDNNNISDDDDRGVGDVDLDLLINPYNKTKSYGIKLLSAPVRINTEDDDIGKKKKQAKQQHDNQKANFISKKQLKKEAKERAKQAVYQRMIENKRKKAEQIKLNAIYTYLNSSGVGQTDVIDIQNIQLSTPDNSSELLNNAHLKFLPGRRYGLVGRNGVGKTTLLRALSYYDIPKFPTHLRVMHVEQEIAGDERSVIQTVLAADIERTMLLEQEKELLSLLDQQQADSIKAKSEIHKQQYRDRMLESKKTRNIQYNNENSNNNNNNDDDSNEDNGGDIDALLNELKNMNTDSNDNYDNDDDYNNNNNDDNKYNDAVDESKSDSDNDDNNNNDQSNNTQQSTNNKSQTTTTDTYTELLPVHTTMFSSDMPPIDRLQRIYDRMGEIDIDGAESRARHILNGLQFNTSKQNMRTCDLSGGWRMRVALASALYVEPDLLLLDEPTNHLDFPAVLWLENYLINYNKTLIIVSHDRSFLNNICTDIIHYHNSTLTYYRGDYQSFERVRLDKQKQLKREFESQQLKREHIQQFIDRFRVNANRASQVQSRIKTLNKMDVLEDIVLDSDIRFNFPQPQRIDNLLISANNISFRYNIGSKYLLSDVTCGLDMDSRVGVLGANGCGKTTLINLLIGKLEPSEGSVYRDDTARIAVFAQHHVEQMRLELSAVELFTQLFQLGTQHMHSIRRHLGQFGLSGDLATSPIGTLSGGQKSRVAFSLVTWRKPHLLILDEPTNHLDLETVDALINALQTYTGGICVVSHDQHFLTSVCSQYWSVSNGKVRRFDSFNSAKKFSYSSS